MEPCSQQSRSSGIIDQTVGPSLEILTQWEEEGKIRGGIFPGERAGAWVFEADSSEELDGMLTPLPFWGQMKWHKASADVALEARRST